jgi:hypothetical protein
MISMSHIPIYTSMRCSGCLCAYTLMFSTLSAHTVVVVLVLCPELMRNITHYGASTAAGLKLGYSCSFGGFFWRWWSKSWHVMG